MARVESVSAARIDGLERRNGRLYVERPDGGGVAAVTVRYLRPLTARSEIVLLDEKGLEVLTLPGVADLPEPQRRLLEEALRERYHLATISSVESVDVRFGTRYWKVETDRGPRWFALREPGKNVTWLSDTRLVLRDTAGNRYEIRDLAALDAASRRWVMRSL